MGIAFQQVQLKEEESFRDPNWGLDTSRPLLGSYLSRPNKVHQAHLHKRELQNCRKLRFLRFFEVFLFSPVKAGGFWNPIL